MLGGELILGQSLFEWLTTYGYFVLPPLIVLLGPIAGFTAGFLASLGVFNPFIVFAIWVLTTTTTDSLLFVLGRFGRGFLKKFRRSRILLYKLEIEAKKENSTWISVFQKHFVKIFFFLKVSPTVAVSDVAAVVAGVLNIEFRRMYLATFLGQLIWSGVFLSLGYYFGGAIQDVNFLINTTGIILGAVFILILIYIKFLHKYLVSKISDIMFAIKELLSPHADSDYDIRNTK